MCACTCSSCGHRRVCGVSVAGVFGSGPVSGSDAAGGAGGPDAKACERRAKERGLVPKGNEQPPVASRRERPCLRLRRSPQSAWTGPAEGRFPGGGGRGSREVRAGGEGLTGGCGGRSGFGRWARPAVDTHA